MGNLKKLGIIALLLLTAFGAGRYSAPSKIEESQRTDVKKEVVTIVREVIRPDGTRTHETITENRNEVSHESTKKVENDKTQYKLTAMAGKSFDNMKDVYGAMVEKRLFANTMVGVWGNTEKQLGLSVGIEF